MCAVTEEKPTNQEEGQESIEPGATENTWKPNAACLGEISSLLSIV